MRDCKPGEGKYLATYELDSLAVLQSPAYLARFQNQTPWSKRCLGKAVVFKRWACEQAWRRAIRIPRPRALVPGLSDKAASPYPSMLQIRKFAASTGERIALYELVSSDRHACLPPLPTLSASPGCRWRRRSPPSALKTLAWWLTGSVGLLSDALESLVNLAAALLALSMLRLAASPPDEEHPYGFSKAEYFSAGIEGALIVLAAAGILFAAMPAAAAAAAARGAAARAGRQRSPRR